MVTIPHNYTARPYQRGLWRHFEHGGKRGLIVWHRRAGKEKTCLNLMVAQMLQRVGAYWYVFPTYTQGKKVLWEGRDKAGFKFLDHIPVDLVRKKNDTELMITLVNGSTLQVIGSDKVDSIVGTNPVGAVFSEFSLQKPSVADILRPIFAENEGWAIYNFTPRGENHAFELLETVKANPAWYVSILTVDDTGAIPLSVIDEERESGASEEIIQQEYYCSFTAGRRGAYYGDYMRRALEDGRIGAVPYDPKLTVYTSWDLGRRDETAIWFFQVYRDQRRYVDYYAASKQGLDHYVKVLKAKPYAYEKHYLPHDVEVHDLTINTSRAEFLENLGLTPTVVPRHSVDERIEAVRQVLPLCWFDQTKCKDGLAALRAYHNEYDEDRKVYADRPEHDWSSHPADSFGYGVMGYEPPAKKKAPDKPNRYGTDYGGPGGSVY
jgi:hypothetical protein